LEELLIERQQLRRIGPFGRGEFACGMGEHFFLMASHSLGEMRILVEKKFAILNTAKALTSWLKTKLVRAKARPHATHFVPGLLRSQ
ncbi:MAG: hypothetical protein ACREF8_06905, partial [Chthoniobacterales bacterium]